MNRGKTFPPVSTYIPGEGELRAVFTTSQGQFVVRLLEDICPNTVSSFVGLATGKGEWIDPQTGEAGAGAFYDGVIFHRIIDGFMIQGGDRTGTGRGGPGYQFDDECDPRAKHDKVGILSMANAGPGTNGSQFFVTLGPTPHLDGRHTVFGEVVEGLDIVQKIGSVPTDGRDKPLTPVVMETIKIERA